MHDRVLGGDPNIGKSFRIWKKRGVDINVGSEIQKVEYYLPETIVDNRDIADAFPEWTPEKIEDKVGICKRHIAGAKETALDMAFFACEKVLAGVDRSTVDFLILCTQSPDYFLPTSACILQDRLDLPTDIGAFDINLGCSGYIYALFTAKAMIQSNAAKTVLVVTSETYSKHIHPQDRGNRIIFGDGAAATLVCQSDRGGILDFSLGTNGRGYKNLIVPNGGMREKYQPDAPELEDKNGCIRTDNHLYMNGPEIFNFTIKTIPGLVKGILSKNQMTLDQIDYVIFHQANAYILNYLRKKIKIPEGKFYMNMRNTGNTVSATIPIALKDCLDGGLVKSGDHVLIAGFGVGYSWGGTIIRIP